MISEDKMMHVLHLMLDGLEKRGLVTFSDKDTAVREGKKVCFQFLSSMNAVAEIARKRIMTQKNPPPEYSSQWDTLYRKYYEEEMKKRGG